MITFKQFITEEAEVLDIPSLCAKFIAESNGIPLYRGTNRKYFTPTVVTTRKDRRPSMTRGSTQELVDNWFEAKYGIRVRSTGLFSSSYFAVATSYGTPYFVLPVGDFKYFWCKSGAEYVVDTYEITRKISNTNRKTKSFEEYTNEVLSEVDWFTTNLTEALQNGAELTLICDKVIMVPTGLYSASDREKNYREFVIK